MRFQTELVPARVLCRYKRFLADCTLEATGQEITAHCANPGSMMGLAAPGTRIWLEPNDDPKKKLKFGWRLVDHENGHFTGVDTSAANRIIHAALLAGELPDLAGYGTVRSEVKYGHNSRIDFLLSEPGLADCYVEVKSVTLSRRPGVAEFPDSVTARGTKHLRALADVAQAGHRAILLYLVLRSDCSSVAIASDIDPAYAQAHGDAATSGVETLCFGANITLADITLCQPLALAPASG